VSSGININMSANSPAEMRELFEKCMAETDKLIYDGKFVYGPGCGQVYVFGEKCPDCNGFGWIKELKNKCATCKGRKEVGPAWVM
jgi:hypothetical protein